MESSTSSNSSSRYLSLTKQVSELQNDLAKTVTLVHSLRSENEALRKGEEQVKGDLRNMKAKYMQLRAQYLSDTEQRVSVPPLIPSTSPPLFSLKLSQEFLKSNADAARKRKLLASAERGSFEGSAGVAGAGYNTNYLKTSLVKGQI